ncbi:pyridoxamine 5'-phosphate oxidase family protein [Pseudarthrobacter sp. C4D7]|uniref:pyridoxamine 5'-phosphate oxidase family protein n=1 Tax=Pseudarthrobacter sp. C4D7 TaxID=2735268 RepID=UPI0015855707|nr:pyridoxamine 5'-phosphate oxidase family protein [Pseudarthrobacter sp. C4D7]NUT73064.1 pyridoxamine 5'-phosphate oxidase [Pseudarthrobacter sp. C4D7]
MSEIFRKFLRTLPDFPSDLPEFDPANAPQDPALLFKQWLDEALDAGEQQPHAFSLATVGGTTDGSPQPSSRMLILKNIDDDGWHFATSRTSRKGRELAESPKAAMNFYWPDWHERPRADGSDNPQWQLYALQPAEIEFWQASNGGRHVRHRVGPDGSPLD